MGREGGKEEETKGKNLKGGGREREEGPAGAKREEEEEEEESHVPTNIASVHLVTGRPNATAVGEKNRPLEQPTTNAAQILPPPPPQSLITTIAVGLALVAPILVGQATDGGRGRGNDGLFEGMERSTTGEERRGGGQAKKNTQTHF